MEKELLETFEAAKKAADEAVESVGKSPEAKRCVDALTNLRKIKVTTDVLVSTQVGKKLRSLTKHPNSEIKSMASDLLAFWKNIVIEESVSAKRNGTTSSSETDKSTKRIKIESRPEPIKIETKLEKPIKIESKSPKAQTPKPQTPKFQTSKPVIKEESKPFPSSPAIKKATPAPSGAPKFTSLLKCHDTNRDRMRELIADAFSRVPSESQKDEREEIQNILDEINSCDYLRAAVTVESSLYEKLGSSTGAHKVKYRSILFNLRAENNTDFRRRVLLGHVNPESLPDLSPEDMASDARRMENNKIKDKALFDCERAAAPKATTDQFKCGRCKQRKTTYYQLQTRSADEPMTTFVTCVNCNNHWKFC